MTLFKHIFQFIYYLFTLHPDSSPPPSPPFTQYLPMGTIHTLAPQVTAGIGTSSPTEAKLGIPVRGTGTIGKQQSKDNPLLQLLGDPHEDQAVSLLHMCKKCHVCFLSG